MIKLEHLVTWETSFDFPKKSFSEPPKTSLWLHDPEKPTNNKQTNKIKTPALVKP